MIQEIEDAIRAGKLAEAKALFQKIQFAKVPRDQKLACANLAGRLGLISDAVRILNSVIRGRVGTPATAAERVAYANNLRRLGAVDEAHDILVAIDGTKEPEALLALAFCFVTKWEYAEAIPALEGFLACPEIAPYKATVARVNLLASLVHEDRLSESFELADALEAELSQTKTTLLLANVMELQAQALIREQKFNDAIEVLHRAKKLLQHAEGSKDSIQTDKWLAISRALIDKKPTTELRAVRKRAVETSQWETVRDCDFFLASLGSDREGLLHLFFGTPFRSFRKRVLDHLGEIPESWEMRTSMKPKRVFDLSCACDERGDLVLDTGRAMHRLLLALCSDFYKPFSVPALFSTLFPGEYFNPESSPNRVHQVVRRLRGWSKDLEIEMSSGSYHLKLIGDLTMRISRDPLPRNVMELELLKLRRLIRSEQFTTIDALNALQCSRSSAQRLLMWATSSGALIQIGKTKATVYKFTPANLAA